jgi:hypothetical protein
MSDSAPVSINTPFTMPVIAGALLPTGSNHLCNDRSDIFIQRDSFRHVFM